MFSLILIVKHVSPQHVRNDLKRINRQRHKSGRRPASPTASFGREESADIMLAMTSVGQSNSLIDWLDKAQFGQDVDVLTGGK